MLARSRDVLEAAIACVDEPQFGAAQTFTKLYLSEARQAADASDLRRKSGKALSALDGAIVSIKDNLDVAGEVTTAGSKILESGRRALDDAIALTRIRQAGCVVLGKTNMSEFAFSGVGLNPHFGTPGNSKDKSLVPGGSSSGAAVSVGDGLVKIGFGTDTGGSIRIPAALNNCVGFKPTARRVPTKGIFPLSKTLDSVGMIARTVLECVAADAVLTEESYNDLTPARPTTLSIGLPAGRMLSDLDPVVAQAFQDALAELKSIGTDLRVVSIDDLLDEHESISKLCPLVSIEAAHVHAERVVKHAASYDPRVLERIRLGMSVSERHYLWLLSRRRALIRRMQERISIVDVMFCPTTPICAPSIATLECAQAFREANNALLRNTNIANFFDLCSLSLPAPRVKNERAVGLMVMAPGLQDRKLLRVALTIEHALSRPIVGEFSG